jgi:peptidoglycan/xylan/chitin deacetylase (PgdA/CDA1 family)
MTPEPDTTSDQPTAPVDHDRYRQRIPRPVRQALYGLTSPLRRRRWDEVPGVQRVPSNKGTVLTFDDGPDERGTGAILEALSSVDGKATFFVLGEHVRENPDLARAVSDQGHELALHGSSHYRHDQLSADEARVELLTGLEALEDELGFRPRWYRPPFGRCSPQLASACEELGLGVVYWSSWGHDWESISAKQIARRVRRNLSPGTIVLLHDSARYAERRDVRPTAEAIPLIAETVRDAGSPLVTLSTALG